MRSELSDEDRVKSDALRLLAAGPRSVEELRGRLKLKRHAESAIEPVLELLIKQGFLDDEKFARLYAVSRTHTRPIGRRQLAMDMKKKGIAGRLIEETLSGLQDYDEKAEALKLARGRFQRIVGLTPEKKKARVFGFLQRRGFSNDTIFAVLEELMKEN